MVNVDCLFGSEPSPTMLAYFALSLLILSGPGFGTEGSCETENKGEAGDGVTCFECGRSSVPIVNQPLATGGRQIAPLGYFPWHATLFLNKDGEWNLICGGTLVTNRVVITTAVCVVNQEFFRNVTLVKPQDLSVVLGKTDRMWNVTGQSEIKRKVQEIRVHPDYRGTALNYAYDIALIVMDSKVQFSEFVMPSCLDYNLNKLPHHQKGDVVYTPGFGKMDENLNYIVAPVMNFDECFNIIQTMDDSQFVSIQPFVWHTPDKFCVGNGTVSPTQRGNAGDGVTTVHNGLHYLTGEVSAKIVKRLGDDFVYDFGGVTNVTRLMDWIKSNLPKDA